MATQQIDSKTVFKSLLEAQTSQAIESLLTHLPIATDSEYTFNAKAPSDSWVSGKLHWYPVGKDRGNAGRIKLAGSPENPIAERAINSMESLIDLQRRLELLQHPGASAPASPRDAVKRYFKLPPLDELPHWSDQIGGMKAALDPGTGAK